MNNLDMYSREKTNQIRLDELHCQAQDRRILRQAHGRGEPKNVFVRQVGGVTVSLAILNMGITLCICNTPC